jgi:hypothetical protein
MFINKFMAPRRKIPDLVHRATRTSGSDGRRVSLSNLFGVSIFDREVSGVSMLDIEQMEHPLSLDEIRALTKVFGVGRFTKQEDLLVIESLTVFACQNSLDSEGANVPVQLRPLYKNITDFFNYYRDFFLNENANWGEVASLYSALNFRPMLRTAIGFYIAAREGISPASTIKLMKQRSESDIPITGSFFFRKQEKPLASAHRKDIVPSDLEQYLQYSPNADKAADQYIEGYYRRLTDPEKAQAHRENDEVIVRTRPYFRKVEAQIRRDPSHRMTFEVPANPTVKDVTITSQDRRTLIFIVRFKDGDAHLTLELTNKGKVFGFPSSLTINNEMLAAAFSRDIFSSCLNMVRELHPEVNENQVQQVFLENGKAVAVKAEDTIQPQTHRNSFLPRVLSPVRGLFKRSTVCCCIFTRSTGEYDWRNTKAKRSRKVNALY